MLDTAACHRLEGVVSKRVDSVYRPETRSRLWLKTAIRQTTEVIIAGWVPRSSSGGGERGALILGVYDESNRWSTSGTSAPASQWPRGGHCSSS
ncbi:hypothetical protein ABZ552_07400 [Nocardia sp. NPDC019219]|uniref:hypothetical protein n=1 Tax=Nocardia TaxID=1817 RepID=UPI00249000F6|nr:hypothetical protein [Nocardia sputorum]